VDDAARAGQLVAQGFARAAAYPFVRLHWHCRLRLGAPGVWLGIPAYGRRWVLERAAGLGKGYHGPAQKDGNDNRGVQVRGFVSTHRIVPALPRTNLLPLPTGRRPSGFPIFDCRPAPGGLKMPRRMGPSEA
jgi:hypothetical protein